MQLLMVLAWQLKSMDEEGNAPSFGASHVRWAQPWRVVPLAMLLKFMITSVLAPPSKLLHPAPSLAQSRYRYPEEDNIAMKLGLPADDTIHLSHQGLWYPALPVMLYLSCYAVMGLYGPIAETALTIAGYILGALFRW